MEEIIIVAGGMNTRLDGQNRGPKTLTEIHSRTILQRIVDTMNTATNGKFRLLIAAGFFHSEILQYVKSTDWGEKDVQVIEANEWKAGNAATLLAVKEYVENDEFLLQMSDHLFDTNTYRKCISNEIVPAPYVCGQPVSDGLPEYLDLDDATKILSDEKHQIEEIGKEIVKWNMIDMGVFRLTNDVFSIIENLPDSKKSLSQYITEWRKTRAFYVSPQPGAIWKDIDTHDDLEWAIRMAEDGLWK
ncbi:MAG: NTP transferase domain-containing protein [Candidatus Thorarchaeota archaeon]